MSFIYGVLRKFYWIESIIKSVFDIFSNFVEEFMKYDINRFFVIIFQLFTDCSVPFTGETALLDFYCLIK